MNNEELIDVKTLRPFRRFIYTIGALPSSYLISMTYEEQLIWFCNYLEKTVIPAIDNNGLAVEELQAKYIELKSYVDNYFDNLDVQEEINNKLDDMAESGELTDIIAQYLQLAGVLAYDTVNDLVNAENIVNGSICKTLGKNTYNDGLGSFYKIRTITSGDIVDGENIIALNISNTLIGEKIFNIDLETLKTEMSLINNKKYLFISDSYETGYQGSGQPTIEGFITKVKNQLNLDALIIAENGYGFLGIDNNLKWKSLIENTTITNKETYTDIFILGGMNDRGTSEQLDNAMYELFTYLENNFPNAIIHVGCVGKYNIASETNLVNMRKTVKRYQVITNNYGHKYITNSEIILHNMSWFISDGIHPNQKGENQLAQAIVQYILNNNIYCLTDITSDNTYQTDIIVAENENTNVSNLTLYSNIEGEQVEFYISGRVNYTTPITLSNLSDIVIGQLTNSYVCGSAYNQGINEYITGFCYTQNEVNGTHFIKVGFRLYNDYNNKLHLKAFTVKDSGDYWNNIPITEINFPYGVIKCTAISRYC